MLPAVLHECRHVQEAPPYLQPSSNACAQPVRLPPHHHHKCVAPSYPRCPCPLSQGVDFGAVRVVDSASKAIVLANTGKYEVQYKLNIGSEALAALVSISPDMGSIAAGKEATVQVREEAGALGGPCWWWWGDGMHMHNASSQHLQSAVQHECTWAAA